MSWESNSFLCLRQIVNITQPINKSYFKIDSKNIYLIIIKHS